ncbi:CAP domain-containing protein [Mesorhizobium sp. L-8-10]|uniref:CAP domain-containing protein n=1 Tax=Mesorhizobium sp. L-8-10 TaxID=2744523 RepID=UPI001FD562F4|nr:CAP domain-containing protein [Mesorhizobium sp. L-8-10]
MAVLVSSCVGTAQPVVAADFGPETLGLVNSYRGNRGLPLLSSHPTLKALARQHSQYQAARHHIGHDGYRERSAKAKAAGTSGICVENVGAGYRDARQLFSGWRSSRRHNRNLLRQGLRYAGISVVGGYATFFACE